MRFDEVAQTQTPTLVNCVDVNTNQLIYSWLLITEVVPWKEKTTENAFKSAKKIDLLFLYPKRLKAESLNIFKQ